MDSEKPSLDAVLDAVRAVLRKHPLDTLTMRSVREAAEAQLKLEEGTLNTKEFKREIKQLVAEFQETSGQSGVATSDPVQSDAASPMVIDEPEEPVPTAKRKAKAKTSETKPAPKRKRNSTVVDSDADESDGPSTSAPPTKKRKSASPKPNRRTKSKPSQTEKAFSQFVGLVAKEMAREAVDAMEEDESANDEDEAKPAGGVITEFDSDLSSVYDEGPSVKKSRKKSKEGSEKKTKKGSESSKKREKKPAAELDKNDEEIKRLKSFVVACGVRKQWAKEFKGLDKPSQQISHLKKILQELGMSGRLSMEKAKSIRAKRELAQELTDVIEFERKRGSGSRTGRPPRPAANSGDSDADDDDEEEVVIKPPKRRSLADDLKAFLGDDD